MMTNFITDDEPENIRKLFEVNVIASCVCVKEAVKLMRGTGKGQIVIMNSILGHRIPDLPPGLKPPFGMYPASKHALTAFVQTLRMELSFMKLPIRVTEISPGMVDTDFLSDFNQHFVAIMPKLKVEDVAEAVKYALSTSERVRVIIKA